MDLHTIQIMTKSLNVIEAKLQKYKTYENFHFGRL